MHNQAETLVQQSPEHQLHRFGGHIGRRFRIDIEPVHFEPAGPSRHLISPDAVRRSHQIEHRGATHPVNPAMHQAAAHVRKIRVGGPWADPNVCRLKPRWVVGRFAKRRARNQDG